MPQMTPIARNKIHPRRDNRGSPSACARRLGARRRMMAGGHRSRHPGIALERPDRSGVPEHPGHHPIDRDRPVVGRVVRLTPDVAQDEHGLGQASARVGDTLVPLERGRLTNACVRDWTGTAEWSWGESNPRPPSGCRPRYDHSRGLRLYGCRTAGSVGLAGRPPPGLIP